MSDTQTIDAPASIPNFSVTKAGEYNGRPVFKVTFGSRSLDLCELDLPSQWDLLEIANGTENTSWFSIATVASSVTGIDGVPVPATGGDPDRIKAGIRQRLGKLGNDGLRAAVMGLEHVAKLSSEPANGDTLAMAGN
jgi:hypothetical protein